MPERHYALIAALVLAVAIVGAAFYAKLDVLVTNEYFHIGQALAAGRGYAEPFGAPGRPTAWMAPVYPTLVAGLYWLGEGMYVFVTRGVAVLQVLVLIGTACLVVSLAAHTTGRVGIAVVGVLFCLGLLYHYWFWFQQAQDCFLILLSLDLLIAGCCWCRPMESGWRAAAWGLLGGFVALTNPIAGFVWAVLSVVLGVRQRTWSRPALALVCAVLALAPWTIRNYLVFGRFIPIKSNLAYELWQSQCLQSDGLLKHTTFFVHPNSRRNGHRERQVFQQLGEIAFLDAKAELFQEAVRANPVDFFRRVGARFVGATLWYTPFNRQGDEMARPWTLWARRLAHPLPFLALTFLLISAWRAPLSWPHWTVLGIYVCYLLPYVAISYYERYAVPLLAVKVLLVLWAGERALTLWRRREITPSVMSATGDQRP